MMDKRRFSSVVGGIESSSQSLETAQHNPLWWLRQEREGTQMMVAVGVDRKEKIRGVIGSHK